MTDETITVGSANVDLGSAFREHAQQRIREVTAKYFGHLTLASVHVTKEGISYRCSINIQMGALKTMTSEGEAKDVPVAFRAALEKVEKQLRRAKRELREDKATRSDKTAALEDGLRARTTS
jgi:ribosomal subunit interface protein